jgi:hypothetical protein
LDELAFSSLSFKFPVFNVQDKIMGVFGISALINPSVLKEAETLGASMERIMQTGLISSSKNILPGFNIEEVFFPSRKVNVFVYWLQEKPGSDRIF